MINKFKYFLSALIVSLMLPILVLAKEGIVLNVSQNDLKPGDEITVTVTLPEDMEAYALMATLKYDENYFEVLDSEDFASDNENTTISFSESTHKFGLINKSGKVSGNLFNITLKVKEDTLGGDTTIALTNIKASDGSNIINFDKVLSSVHVTGNAKDNELVNNNKEEEINDDNEPLIKAVSNKPVIITLSIAGILGLILLIYFIVKFKAITLLIGILGLGEIALIIALGILVNFNLNKKDVNNDGVKDYNDAQEIIDYLINITSEEEEEVSSKKPVKKPSNNNNNSSNTEDNNKEDNNNTSVPNIPDLDTNNDGKVDLNDAGHTASEVKTTVKVSDPYKENDYYVKKGEITLRFRAEVSPKGISLYKVKINDEFYDVTPSGEDYVVTIIGHTEAGVQTFKMTEVYTSNDKEIPVNLTMEREILKEVPSVTNFSYNEENKSLSFDILDDDKVLENGKATILKDNKEITSMEIKQDKNVIENLELIENDEYKIEVKGSYDLDKDKDNDKNNYQDEIIFSHTFKLLKDYNFTLTGFSITDSVVPGEFPIVSFTSTNRVNAKIESAMLKINDTEAHEYSISKKEGNNYEITLTNADTSFGKHTVSLESVELNTLKSFKNKEDYTVNNLTYYILKRAPKAENINLVDEGSNQKIKVSFKLADEDKTFNALKVVLVDSLGKIIDQKVLSEEEITYHEEQNVPIELSYEKGTDGLYTVRFLADYTLGDKYKYTNQNIGEAEILTHSDDIYISELFFTTDGKTDSKNYYPAKGEKNYQLAVTTFVGDSINNYAKAHYKNTAYQTVSNITINDLNYTASAVSGYRSRVFLNVPNTSGVMELKVSRVQLAINNYYNIVNDFYSVTPKIIKIDVLKDMPKVENLIISDDYEKEEVTFDFDIILDENATSSEDEFKDGLLKLGDKTYEVTRGHNHIILEGIPKDKILDLVITASFDLDTDDEDINKITGDINEYQDKEIYNIKYGLFSEDTYKDIRITDGALISKKNNAYFEKEENIRYDFNIIGLNEELNMNPVKAKIDNKEYDITKTSTGYSLTLDGYPSAGKKTLTITDIIFDNGKFVTLNSPCKFTFEVLKDVLRIKDFRYEEEDNEIKIYTTLKDNDHTLMDKAIVTIEDDRGNIETKEYDEELTISKKDDVLRYYIKINASFDRDQEKLNNSDNYQNNVIVLSEIINLEKNNIELKDIIDISLYKIEKENGEEIISLINEVSVSDIEKNYANYFVEVVMNNLPSVRARIRSVATDNNQLTFDLEYEFVTHENKKETKEIFIPFGEIVNGKAKNEGHPDIALASLLEKLNNNDNIKLTKDYDASVLNLMGDYYINEYTGTLEGNGHTIKNLTKPLFNTISGGKVSDLRLEDIKLSNSNARGALANTVKNATIEKVLVNNLTKVSDEAQVGTLIGYAENSKIENCRATGFNISFNSHYQQIGGLIGRSNASTIKNCYTSGKINGGWNFRGGLIGYAISSTVENNFTNVSFSSGYGNVLCGGILQGDSNNTIRNNVSFTTGYANAIANTNKVKENNYYLSDESTNEEGALNFTKDENLTYLFVDKAGFSPDIWDFRNASLENLPSFAFENKTKLEKEDNYEESKEILYRNLMRLMPFYDNAKIIETGKNITDSDLTTKEIKHIVPISKDGSLTTYLTTDDYKKISKIKIIFTDNTTKEYNLSFDKIYDMVVTYRLNDLNIDYNYGHYVIDTNSQIVNNLVNYLKKLDYTNNLDILTTNNDSRIYRDFYNDVTSQELKEFVLKFLANSNYTSTSSDESINNYLEREIKDKQRIEKVLYVYNYFRRFYDLDIDGMKIYDFMLFNMEGFDKSLTPSKIADLFLEDTTGANFNTNETNTKYNKVLSSYTKLNTVSKLLEYLVTNLSDYDMDEWVRSEFKGILRELPVYGNEDILYTLWDHFSHEDNNSGLNYRVYNFVLPILTLPENAAYIISSPVQFIIGAQRTYITDPFDSEQHEAFLEKLDSYTTRMQSYYETAYAILKDPKLFNNMHLFQIDKRITKNEYGIGVSNTPYSTTEPFHKNFNEVVNLWAANAAVNAAAWGSYIEWQVAGVLDSTLATDGTLDVGHVTYKTWSHESAHNIDARLFLKNNGRRFDSGGEDYADSFLMQSFEEFGMVMNLSINFNDNLKVGSNLRPDRINSEDKIYEFYNRAFNTIYTMDYLEALAFLELSDEEKANVAIQVSYPNENLQFARVDGKADGELTGKTYGEDEYAIYMARRNTRYNLLTADDFANMELNSIDDIIKNRLMIYPGITGESNRGVSLYGGEGFNVVHWYQPNNPEGRPDSYSLKWISYEMLGYAGYDKGFVEYASNRNYVKRKFYANFTNPSTDNLNEVNFKSDKMALKTISEGKFEDFDEYKKYRFNEAKNNLGYINPNYVNVKEYVQEFYEALVKDAAKGDRKFTNSTALRSKLYYALKNNTNDFRSDIYESSIQQDTSDLHITK